LESIQLRRNFSRNTLIRMFILAALGVALLVWKFDFINNVYFRDQLTPTGLAINGAILGLFLLGLARIIGILLRYSREESAIQLVLENLEEGVNPLLEVPGARIISHRYRTLEALHESSTPINHDALASTLVATESTRSSFPRFINNILILSGVFGTIVSLSIALIGASDLLGTAINTDGMGLVIHGMSTALSTTITAIVCYLYFGYFFLKLTDAQTNLVSAVEQVTSNFFLPRFQVRADTVLHQFAGLIRSLQELLGQMRKSQHAYADLAQEMRSSHQAFEDLETRIISALVEVYKTKIQPVTTDMDEIKTLLKLGFRLPDEP
jgi:hypothetical protein